MEAIAGAIRAHPIGCLLYLALGAYMFTQLVGMLRGVWAASKTPPDRRAAAALTLVLGVAFCFLFSFLFHSVFL